MRLITLLLLLTLTAGCAALPTAESFRPRGVDFWAQGGRSTYQDGGRFRSQGRGKDWAVGANMHWDISYADESEE